jgi:CubicO group peptidase (beta-lactamase class C family)
MDDGATAGDEGDPSRLFRQRCEKPADAIPAFANAGLRHSQWILTSAAIEAAAGVRFLSFMRDAVFQPLGMTHTGAESSQEENPDAVGEPAEDPPPFTMIRRLFFQPLGLGRSAPRTAKDVATLYVPRGGAGPRDGRHVMRLGNLSCYAGAMAFYSTASDLVRVGLAVDRGTLVQAETLRQIPTTRRLRFGQVQDGTLGDGTVASLIAPPDRRIVVAVASNITHADTSTIARLVAQAFSAAAQP